jgi:hypothetical protein
MSTYFGSITIVLKFPFTSELSTKGLQRYNALGGVETGDEGFELEENVGSVGEKVAEVGVVERLPDLGALVIDRPIELKKDILNSCGRYHREKEATKKERLKKCLV